MNKRNIIRSWTNEKGEIIFLHAPVIVPNSEPKTILVSAIKLAGQLLLKHLSRKTGVTVKNEADKKA